MVESRAQGQRQEVVGHRTGKSLWLRVGLQVQEVGDGRRRKGRRKRWLRSDCRWSDAKTSRSDCRWSDAMAWKWSDAMAWRMATNACH